MPDIDAVRTAIIKECESLCALLLAKNDEYGNSALEPINIFAEGSAAAQLAVRIDDKLSRISTTRQMVDGDLQIHEDTVLDLLGYLVLLRVDQRLEE